MYVEQTQHNRKPPSTVISILYRNPIKNISCTRTYILAVWNNRLASLPFATRRRTKLTDGSARKRAVIFFQSYRYQGISSTDNCVWRHIWHSNVSNGGYQVVISDPDVIVIVKSDPDVTLQCQKWRQIQNQCRIWRYILYGEYRITGLIHTSRKIAARILAIVFFHHAMLKG